MPLYSTRLSQTMPLFLRAPCLYFYSTRLSHAMTFFEKMPLSNKCGAWPADQRAAPRGVRGREFEPVDHALLSLSKSGPPPTQWSTILYQNLTCLT